jgi:TatD DNase family protein
MAIGGKITYPSSSYLREALKEINIERLVSETDCPFLSPVPFRNEPNTPNLMLYSIKQMSETLGIEISEISKILFENAKKLFAII